MIKEALEYLRRSWEPTALEVDGVHYAAAPLAPIAPPLPQALRVETLAGFVDAINAKVGMADDSEDRRLVQIESPDRVLALDAAVDHLGRRVIYIIAERPARKEFAFDSFMAPESFVIGLESLFRPVEDFDYVLKVASNLVAEIVTTSTDDGISQQAALSRGVTLKGIETIRHRVRLSPYRTFTEITDQPVSDFVLRLRNAREGDPPWAALFEADGGAWRQTAIASIKAWLTEELSIPILA